MTTPRQVLQKFWGYDDFRSLQSEVIDSVLQGNDTIALLATGAGKSVCYQVPAMCLPGKTVVVSPLIALMQDQVDALNKKGIMARAIYAGLGYRKVDLILDNFMNGPLKLLYLSPERLESADFMERFKRTDVSLIAVDESHCISQWGHDFRPSYHNILKLREWKPDVPVIAVTATATPAVVEDITDKLDLKSPKIIQSTFGRDNLSLTIMLTEEKMNNLSEVLHKMKGSGIIYMRSRAKVEALSKYLNNQGITTDFYHGGLNIANRNAVQEDWIKNKTRIIVCTNAFGMGVDKSDVRFVIHCDVPPSIEEYYQEAGRAGRDGKMSYAISLVGYSDFVKLQQLHLISFPEPKVIEDFYYKICNHLKIGYGSGAGESFDVDLEEFSRKYRIPIANVYSCLSILEKEGWLALNGAYRKPSKMVFTSAKSNISLSSRNRGLKSEMLLYMIRNFEGVFMDFVDIDEGKMANALNVKKSEIEFELKVMDRETILSYQPSTTLPRLLFLLDRPAKDSFSIDIERYNKRKENAAIKMNAIQDLMSSFDCRQQAVLKYFGEEVTECGICDICKGSKSNLFSDEEKMKLFDHLKSHLNNGRLYCEDYLQLWPYNKRNKAFSCIQQLLKENFIEIDDQNIITLKKNG